MNLENAIHHHDLVIPGEDALRAIAIASLDESGHGIALFNSAGCLCLANTTFLEAVSAPVHSRQAWFNRLSECDVVEQISTVDRRGVDASQLCESGNRDNGRIRHFTMNSTNGRCWWITESTRDDGWLAVFTSDITSIKAHERALQRAHDEAVRAANTDELTGTYNRRYILTRLEQAITDVNLGGATFCVCLLDLDHFKEINDVHGHAAGDRVIRHFTVETQRHLRPTDVLGRIGGEEFLLLLHDTTISEATQVIERVRRILGSAAPALAIPEFRYTFSAGITMGQVGNATQDVMQLADRALYEAKRAGRDRHVVLAADPDQTC